LKRLSEVITFHHPGFDPERRTSFPTVEQLLSEMMTNEQLFTASRSAPGKFTLDRLNIIRRELLLAISAWFHHIHSDTFEELPDWLTIFRDEVVKAGDTIISFNWDLILDRLLFEDEVRSENYGFGHSGAASITLLKPHGSLNWYDGTQGTRIKPHLRVPLRTNEHDDTVYAFKHFRSPRSKNKYMPMIIPPVFNKDFSHGVFRHVWRTCVSRLSKAKRVVFLGYSLPEIDLHARFIFRCGFYNQINGELLPSHTRSKPTGKSTVVIVNPDQSSANRIERAVGSHICCDWQPMTVAKWVQQQAVPDS
jgi:hypothetical protein